MAATKSSATFTWASGSSTTSGTTNSISTATHYADTIYGSLVVAGTPTVSASVQVQTSPDGSTFYNAGAALQFPLVAATYPFEVPIDPACQAVQVVYTVQTGGTSSTLTMQLCEVTGI